MFFAGSLLNIFVLGTSAGFLFWISIRGKDSDPSAFLHRIQWGLGIQSVAMVLSLLIILYQSVFRDFSSVYVAENVNLSLPLFYRITALWGAQAGSLAVWATVSLLFSWYVARAILPRFAGISQPVATIFFISSLFYAIILGFSGESDPFRFFADTSGKIVPVPDGRGLNPLLHHWAMIIHPPILYLGYIALIVPYALGSAAGLSGEWTKEMPPETIKEIKQEIKKWMWFSVYFLGSGILLGALWSYDELGWGGFWSWDPVENASLLPFLAGVAYLHLPERAGVRLFWLHTAYIGSILGIFLTRSGLVTSVHAFGGSELGFFFVLYLVFLLGVSGYLFLRRKARPDSMAEQKNSSQILFLLRGIFLLMFVILVWGSLFPSMGKLYGKEMSSLTESWFNRWMSPLGAATAVLLLVYDAGKIRKHIFWAMLFGAIFFTGTYRFFHGRYGFLPNEIFLMVILVSVFYLTLKIPAHFFLPGKIPSRLLTDIIHLSMVVVLAGLGGKVASVEKSHSVRTGEIISFEGKNFLIGKMSESRKSENVNSLFESYTLDMEVYSGNQKSAGLHPEIRIYPMYSYRENRFDHSQRTTEPDVLRGILADDYVQFNGMNDHGEYVINIIRNDLAVWVWFGFLGFVLSGAVFLLQVWEKNKDWS